MIEFCKNSIKMARTITDEQIKLNIIINGNPAQKQLFDLEKSTRELNKTLADQRIEKQKLEKQGLKDTQQYKDLTESIKANSQSLENNKATMKELQNQIGLTGLTMGQLNQKAMALKLTLKNLIPGSEDYKKYEEELNAVRERIAEVTGSARQSQSSIGTIADSFNRYQGLAVSTIAAFTGVAYSISQVIDLNAKLSDAQANVMKTTGMTKAEVDDLTKSFGELNTRTSRVDLLKIAEQGGRLGVPKAEIQDFVKSMNIAAVALGDSFTGGVDEVAEKLGKIKFLFKETKDMNIEQAYSSIGSAINDLGANGVASEANIAEFTKRIGSLTDVLKPTVQETLALGTAFEESGIEAETSSRAYNIFMKQASTEADKFAKVMNISKKSVEDMINTNPMDFMLEFARGMNGMNATEVAKTLDYLGVNADGANKVIGAMGNNFDRFHQLIDLSNNSFATGTSLIKEYNVKNENLAATLEKISKKISGWFSSDTLIKYLGSFISWFGKFIGATEDASGYVTAFRNTLFFTAKVIGIVTAALITNVGWQKLVAMWTTRNTEATLLYNIASKARAFADGVSVISGTALAVVGNLLTLNFRQAAVSFRLMTAAMMTTPWGFIIGAVAAIGTAYVMFSEKVDKAAKIQKLLNDVHEDAAKSISKEKSELERLVAIAKDERIAKEKRFEAIKKINEISPEYLSKLSLENIATAEGTALLKKYTDELYANARAKSLQKKFDELSDQKLEKENKSSKDYKDETYSGQMANLFGQEVPIFKDREELNQYIFKNFGKEINKRKDKDTGLIKFNKSLFEGIVNSYLKMSGLDLKENDIRSIEEQMQALEKEIKANTIKDLGEKEPNEVSKYNTNLGDGKDGDKSKKNPNSSEDDLRKLRNDDNLKYAAEVLKNERQIEDARIAMMEDGIAKELAIENQRYERKLEDLQKQKVHDTQMIELQAEADKAYQAGDIKKYDQLLLIKKGWKERNDNLDGQIKTLELQERGIHNRKLHELELKAFDQSVKDTVDKYEHQKLLRDTAYNNELAAAGNNALLREDITKKHNKLELDAQLKHLQDLANLMKFELFSPAGLSLTDKERKAFQEKLDFYENAISKLKSAQKGDAGGKEIDLGIKGGNDILGFSQTQWEGFFKNIEQGTIGFQTMAMAMGAAANVLGEMDKLFTAQENAEVKRSEGAANAKKNHLKKQLDSGVINQKQYNRRIEKIDKELDDKKFEAELAQAKRQRVIALSNIAINTAQAIIGAWAKPGFPMAIPLTALIAGMGIIQASTVLATPLPVKGYEDGLYSQNITRQQDGKIFKANFGGQTKSGIVNKPTYFLTGENGPEMIIDSQSYAQMPPAIRQSLESYIFGRTNNMRGYEQGYYSQPTPKYTTQTTTQPATTSTNNDEMMRMMIATLQRNNEIMERIEQNGILAKVDNNDFGSMKKLKEGIKKYEDLNNRSKY